MYNENMSDPDMADYDSESNANDSKEPSKVSKQSKKKQKKEHLLQAKIKLKEQGFDDKTIKKMAKNKKPPIGKGALQINKISQEKSVLTSQGASSGYSDP